MIRLRLAFVQGDYDGIPYRPEPCLPIQVAIQYGDTEAVPWSGDACRLRAMMNEILP